MSENHNRRDILAGASLIAGLAGWGRALAADPRLRFGPSRPFSFDRLTAQAKEMAAQPFIPSPAPDPNLTLVDFDAYGQINYDPALTLWGHAGEPAVRLFPQGRMFKDSVQIHLVSDGAARTLVYNPDLFTAPANSPFHRLKGVGFAGFRVMGAEGQGDWLAFLGAAYFRTSGPFNQYGASARGLAINSGGPGKEEFPRFTQFWLERAAQGGLITYALLEGPSVCGAYRIDNHRGADGVTQAVDAALFFRAPVETLGVAPITSMFWYGENSPPGVRDWRPEIHDSDGLALHTGAGEQIWRPLDNPPRVITNSYQDDDPKGFGLLQRDRLFDHYQDDGAFYEKRASVWIEPTRPFGKGSVRLLEIPTVRETDDNIGAFWTPAQAIVAGSILRVGYKIHWLDQPMAGPLAQVDATRIGRGGRPGLEAPAGARRVAIDFSGDMLKGLTRDSGVSAVVTADQGALISDVSAYPVVGTPLWRLIFDVSDVQHGPVNIRAYLRRDETALSETWLYQMFPV